MSTSRYDAHLSRAAVGYHKYVSNIASSGFSGLTAVENRFAT
jgi:hypothetical protein